MPVKVIPVVCALGMTSKKLKLWLSDIGIETRIVEYRKLPSYILQGSSEMFLREREKEKEKEKGERDRERQSITIIYFFLSEIIFCEKMVSLSNNDRLDDITKMIIFFFVTFGISP